MPKESLGADYPVKILKYCMPPVAKYDLKRQLSGKKKSKTKTKKNTKKNSLMGHDSKKYL